MKNEAKANDLFSRKNVCALNENQNHDSLIQTPSQAHKKNLGVIISFIELHS